MNRLLLLVLFTVCLAPLTTAQTPQKIHDLKSLTDSVGTVHLFYRIYAEYEGTEYFTDNIYHYNTNTGIEELFLEHFYDVRFGFPLSSAVTDYTFLENDPQNVVLTQRYCDNECSDFVGRKDSSEGMGGLFVTIKNLNVEGTDTGRVYVEAFGEVVIGKNGGRDWPEPNEDNDFEVPDSSKLDFPLISLSPYNDSFMFGKKLYHSDGENAFLRSLDKGKTSEFISDTLLPANVSFDVDSKTVYIIDVLSTPVPEVNCEINTCNYGLFINEYRGITEDWELKQIFPSSVNTPSFPKILTHPTQSGKLYVWNADSVLMTEDYGGNFEVLTNPTQELTGFTATQFGEYYTTNSTLYKKEGENSVELFSIPVSNEAEVESPEQFELLQNYPNPFNPVTTITYRMRTAGIVSIELYTIQGQRVRELVNDFKTEGQHSFRLNGSDLASGIYILRGKMGVQTETRKITLIK
ncbi:T9SS type A sorting domain-containing protein [Rhodohalobacter sp. 8-1]|uniref:T9SS type A sorting domain-containing protein n=1 Tax=Rhodohalobacter sp. 8-1 TaxID=3131972 RepID=UPI0030EE2079